MIEVEIKIKITDQARVAAALKDMGFSMEKEVRELDVYYDHPGYDVRAHDKALRIRSTEILRTETSEKEVAGSVTAFLTYKGPKLDTVSMSREEIELAIPDASAMDRILTGMGFVPMLPVDKTRIYLEKGEIHACVDLVRDLGSFLELEILAEREDMREEKLQKIKRILCRLGLSMEDTVTTSYLTMLQKKQAG